MIYSVGMINMAVIIPDVNGRIMINMEIVHMECNEIEDMNKRLVDAELKVWKKVEDIAYAVGKHPDEVYADLIIQFQYFTNWIGKSSSFIPISKYFSVK
jgi:hypothetical protein